MVLCLPCLAPIALAAAAGAGVGSKITKKRMIKEGLYWSAVTIIMTIIIILIYYIFFKKCSTCSR